MSFVELAKERYSCRKFSDKAVEQAKIDAIIEAANAAPTAKNVQPVKVWVIRSEEALAKIKQCTPFKWMENVQVVFAVGATKEGAFVRPSDGKNFAEIDASIVATHIMLAVADLGLATTWVGMFEVNKVHELFPETEGWDMVALFPVGYAAEDAAPSERHSIRRNLAEYV